MFEIETLDHIGIRVTDGTVLAARLWKPDTPERVPALIECTPYRKGDGTAIVDPVLHGYLASRGFASLRVDLRGSGDSGGAALDEYAPQELADIEAVIAWLTQQPWCNGKVGMLGISWGGFNALQVAALRPRGLASIVTACSTDDRYGDDVHYRGGTVLFADMLSWATTMLAFSARPPDPQTVGEDWRTLWQARLDALPDYPALWLSEQRRSAYWRHGSVCEDYDAIEVPVYVVGGLADAYTNAALRLDRNLASPHRTLIGPWGHSWPHGAVPGPNVDFPSLCAEWFEASMAGTPPTGTTFFLRGSDAWIDDVVTKDTNWFPAEDGLGDVAGPGTVLAIPRSTGHGRCSGDFCPSTVEALPTGQSADDDESLVFTSSPFEADTAFVGFPRLDMFVRADQPIAQLIGRLCAVDAQGRSRLVSRAILNLTRRNSMSHPEPMPIGEWVHIQFDFDVISDQFFAGERLRLCLADACWPMVLPAPCSPSIEVDTAQMTLSMPVVTSCRHTNLAEPQSVGADRMRVEILSRPDAHTKAEGGRIEKTYRGATIRYPGGMTVASRSRELLERYLMPTASSERQQSLAREGWEVDISVNARLVCHDEQFALSSKVTASLNGEVIFERESVQDIARDLM
ncbi:MAG: CocE/NonD family hydrolase [Pseudomonadales bacterium]|nr:CocE/NonD family hydrolase [Pseudomonadales bacterium]